MLYLGIDLAWGEGTAGRRANESGVVALEGAGIVRDAGWTCGVEETVSWIERIAEPDTLLMVDAPLMVENPTGQREAEREVGRRYGRWHVSANSTNLTSPRLAGVILRERLESVGWRYDDGRAGPPRGGRRMSECYPYTTLVGALELGYDDARPRYKRKPRRMRVGDFRPLRAHECDELIRRMSGLADAHPPLHFESHPETRRLTTEASPLGDRDYKHREDLIDAALCAWTAALWHQHGISRCQVLGGTQRPTDGAPVATIIAPARPEQRAEQPTHV